MPFPIEQPNWSTVIISVGVVMTAVGSLSSALAAAWPSGYQPPVQRRRTKPIVAGALVAFIGGLVSAWGGVMASSEAAKLNQQVLGSISGGDSFAYLKFIFQGNDPDRPLVVVIHQGRYPLYDVSVRIVDQDKWNKIGRVDSSLEALRQAEAYLQVGNLPPKRVHLPRQRWLMPNRQQVNYLVEISARNGSVTELLRLRRVAGEWRWALRVTRGMEGEILLVEEIEPEFPGQVQW